MTIHVCDDCGAESRSEPVYLVSYEVRSPVTHYGVNGCGTHRCGPCLEKAGLAVRADVRELIAKRGEP